MKDKQEAPEAVDKYVAGFPPGIRTLLKKMRATIKKAAPQATEKISYQIPTFALKGNLVHFAAFKNHIGFYPTSSAVRKFKEQLSPYAGAKGSVRFPLDKPIPFGLVTRIVKFRVHENLQREKTKVRK